MSDNIFKSLWYRLPASLILFLTGTVNIVLATANVSGLTWWVLFSILGIAMGSTHLLLMGDKYDK